MTRRVDISVELLVDGVAVLGFPYEATLHCGSVLPLNITTAALTAKTLKAPSQSVRLLCLDTSAAATVKLHGQAETGDSFSAHGVLLIVGGQITTAPQVKVTSTAGTQLRGILAGEDA